MWTAGKDGAGEAKGGAFVCKDAGESWEPRRFSPMTTFYRE